MPFTSDKTNNSRKGLASWIRKIFGFNKKPVVPTQTYAKIQSPIQKLKSSQNSLTKKQILSLKQILPKLQQTFFQKNIIRTTNSTKN